MADFKTISSSIKTKKDLHFVLSVQCKSQPPEANSFVVELYLPPEPRCSLAFMQEVLKGSRKAISVSDVKRCSIPFYPELSVKNLMAKCTARPDILCYFPDPKEKKALEKEFVWHVLRHLAPEFIASAIKAAQTSRAARKAEPRKEHVPLVVEPEMLQRLSRLTMIRSKRNSNVC